MTLTMTNNKTSSLLIVFGSIAITQVLLFYAAISQINKSFSNHLSHPHLFGPSSYQTHPHQPLRNPFGHHPSPPLLYSSSPPNSPWNNLINDALSTRKNLNPYSKPSNALPIGLRYLEEPSTSFQNVEKLPPLNALFSRKPSELDPQHHLQNNNHGGKERSQQENIDTPKSLDDNSLELILHNVFERLHEEIQTSNQKFISSLEKSLPKPDSFHPTSYTAHTIKSPLSFILSIGFTLCAFSGIAFILYLWTGSQKIKLLNHFENVQSNLKFEVSQLQSQIDAISSSESHIASLENFANQDPVALQESLTKIVEKRPEIQKEIEQTTNLPLLMYKYYHLRDRIIRLGRNSNTSPTNSAQSTSSISPNVSPLNLSPLPENLSISDSKTDSPIESQSDETTTTTTTTAATTNNVKQPSLVYSLSNSKSDKQNVTFIEGENVKKVSKDQVETLSPPQVNDKTQQSARENTNNRHARSAEITALYTNRYRNNRGANDNSAQSPPFSNGISNQNRFSGYNLSTSNSHSLNNVNSNLGSFQKYSLNNRYLQNRTGNYDNYYIFMFFFFFFFSILTIKHKRLYRESYQCS